MKKYILAVMLVLLSASFVVAESDIERRVRIGHIEFRNPEDEIADFARKNDLSKLACVNCKKVGGLYIDGIVLGCTKCNIHSLKGEYQSKTQFYEGQKVLDIWKEKGIVNRIEELINQIFSGLKQVNAATTTCNYKPIKIKCELIIGEEEKPKRLLVRELIGTDYGL